MGTLYRCLGGGRSFLVWKGKEEIRRLRAFQWGFEMTGTDEGERGQEGGIPKKAWACSGVA